MKYYGILFTFVHFDVHGKLAKFRVVPYLTQLLCLIVTIFG